MISPLDQAVSPLGRPGIGPTRYEKIVGASHFSSEKRWYRGAEVFIIERTRFGRPGGRPSQGDEMAKKAAAKRKPNAAFMKPVQPSDKLAEVVGSKAIPRTEVTKKLWAYIKKNGLQDKKNKRMIKADDALKAVFGGKATVDMFEMTKLVSKHLK
jgi:chromatin remodeling complex protein RSC6